jgi:hypothetical protein
MPRRASSVPPLGSGPPDGGFLISLLSSSHVALQSQPSRISATSESENQEELNPTSETSQGSPTQEEPPVPASRPLFPSPTSIDVPGTLLRCGLFVPYVDILAKRKHESRQPFRTRARPKLSEIAQGIAVKCSGRLF